jgi:hypothetical protein
VIFFKKSASGTKKKYLKIFMHICFKNNYRYQLFLVIICALAMFLFDLIERGIQLRYPFWSVWDTTHGKNAAYAMPVVGGACGVLYTSYLLFIVAKVSFNLIKRKEHFVGRLHAEGLIIRFQEMVNLSLKKCIRRTKFFFKNDGFSNKSLENSMKNG